MKTQNLKILPLPYINTLYSTKLKAFADDKFNVAKMMQIESIVRKRRKRLLPAFSPHPTMFSYAFF